MKLNIYLQFNPEISLLGIYPTEMKTHAYTNTCRHVHSSFIYNIQNWKQPNVQGMVNV